MQCKITPVLRGLWLQLAFIFTYFIVRKFVKVTLVEKVLRHTFLFVGLTGGLRDVFLGLPGFYIVHLVDRGFKRYLAGGGASFLAFLQHVGNTTGGRVRYFCPLDSNDRYTDIMGQSFPPPATPPGMVRGRLLFDLQANASRALCTMHRSPVEGVFGRDWDWCLMAARSAAPQQYLRPYGEQPTPQVSLLAVIQYVHGALMYETARPWSEVFHLPPGVSHADIGRITVHRMDKRNWLDPFTTTFPSLFLRQNMFQVPTLPHLAMGAQGLLGGLRRVNVLNPVETEFPQLTMEHLNEVGCGGYLTSLVRHYLSSYRHIEVSRNLGNQFHFNFPLYMLFFSAYLNLANYHATMTAPIATLTGFVFDQVVQPANWFAAWNTSQEPWVPCRFLLIPKVPSKYQRTSRSVVLAYIPTSHQFRPDQDHITGFKSPVLKQLRMYICGPRTPTGCVPGARTVSCCAHVATAIGAAGIEAYTPGIFRNSFRQINYLDPGNMLPPAHFGHCVAGTIS